MEIKNERNNGIRWQPHKSLYGNKQNEREIFIICAPETLLSPHLRHIYKMQYNLVI